MAVTLSDCRELGQLLEPILARRIVSLVICLVDSLHDSHISLVLALGGLLLVHGALHRVVSL